MLGGPGDGPGGWLGDGGIGRSLELLDCDTLPWGPVRLGLETLTLTLLVGDLRERSFTMPCSVSSWILWEL